MIGRKLQTIPSGTEHLAKAAVFVAVVRNGSFVRAGQALGMARSTVSEHIRGLERALQVRLLDRTTRMLRLTEEGALLYDQMSTVLGAWEEARVALEGRRSEPVGTLRVTAPGGLATAVVAPALCRLMSEHPGVSVRLLGDDVARDLAAEHIDVAIRLAPPASADLIVRQLGTDVSVFVAAPSLVPRCVGGVAGLRQLPWVGRTGVSERRVALRDRTRGDDQAIEFSVDYRAEASSAAGQLALTAGGAGIGLMPSLLVQESIAQGRLVRVFPDLRGREAPIYAIYPARVRMPARVVRFLSIISETLARG